VVLKSLDHGLTNSCCVDYENDRGKPSAVGTKAANAKNAGGIPPPIFDQDRTGERVMGHVL
jgi:hypothetical protein